LRPLQRLDGRLLVNAENDRFGGRVHIKADNIGGFLRKIGVVALAPGLARRQIDLVVPQAAPDILDIDIAQCLGQQRPRPPPKALGWRLVQQAQYPLVRCRRVERLLARMGLVLQPLKAVIGIAMPPQADNPRLNPDFLGDRPRTPALCRKQNDPCPLQIALQRPRRSTHSLQNLTVLPGKSNFSCFGNHPDLESRLTSQEKRVLG